jgi:cell division septation protein DedD
VFAGLDASVQQATTDKGDIRFRVMVGPFGDEPAMQKARQQLAGMKIDSLPVRLK